MGSVKYIIGSCRLLGWEISNLFFCYFVLQMQHFPARFSQWAEKNAVPELGPTSNRLKRQLKRKAEQCVCPSTQFFLLLDHRIRNSAHCFSPNNNKCPPMHCGMALCIVALRPMRCAFPLYRAGACTFPAPNSHSLFHSLGLGL